MNINSVSMHNQDTKKIHYATGKDQEIHVNSLHSHVKEKKETCNRIVPHASYMLTVPLIIISHCYKIR